MNEEMAVSGKSRALVERKEAKGKGKGRSGDCVRLSAFLLNQDLLDLTPFLSSGRGSKLITVAQSKLGLYD